MVGFRERYMVDEKGIRVGVLLDITYYQHLLEELEELEELEAIRASDSAKASGDEVLPFDQAVQEIQRDH
jgi:hypothetical protein